jgi:hypothetical protein
MWIRVSNVLYQAIVKKKLEGRYKTADESIRPLLGLPPGLCPNVRGGRVRTMKGCKLDYPNVEISSEVYWFLVKIKLQGKYRSIDVILRPLYGLSQIQDPRLKDYYRDEDCCHLTEKTRPTYLS